MDTITRAARKLPKGWGKNCVAHPDDGPQPITRPTRLIDPSHPTAPLRLIYLPASGGPGMQDLLGNIYTALEEIPYVLDSRTSGLVTVSRVFGYLPRISLRRDYCVQTRTNRDTPAAAATLMAAGARIARAYERVAPRQYAAHMADAAKVLPQWRMGQDMPWTSGIVNRDNQLTYHVDKGNFPDRWSAQLTLNQDIEGGWLVLPQYRLHLRLGHGSLLFFFGQDLLHGVTPFTRLGEAHRYSIVFYSMAGMWQCLHPDEEIKRIQTIRVGREARRAAQLVETPEEVVGDAPAAV